MTNINLLPWREQLREELKKQFFLILGAGAFGSIAIIFVIHLIISNFIQTQTKRNEMLETQIDYFDRQIKEVKNLQTERQRLLTQIGIIRKLQADRTQVVQVFNDLVRAIPEGIYLTSMKREGNKITLVGKSESNTRVSSLMRNIEATNSLTQPILNEIKTTTAEETLSNDFILQLQIKTSSEPEKGAKS